jgi:hypothetical protein
MKNFLAVYTGTPANMEKWTALDDKERKRREETGFQAWMDWMAKHKASIVEQGSPLGKTKRIGPDGITDTRNNLAGYIVVKAESHEDAARMFVEHPHFTLFPGEAVEIMECLPLPPR